MEGSPSSAIFSTFTPSGPQTSCMVSSSTARESNTRLPTIGSTTTPSSISHFDSNGTTSLNLGSAGRNDPWCARAAALQATNSPGEPTQPKGIARLRMMSPASLTANSGTSLARRKCHLKARGTSLLAHFCGIPGCLAFHQRDCRATA